MKLSDYFNIKDIIQDGEFDTLGYVDSLFYGTLVYCDNIFYLKKANKNKNITCILTSSNLIKKISTKKGVVICNLPRNWFYKLHLKLLNTELYLPKIEYGLGDGCKIHSSAIVSEKTRIGKNVIINENVIIKDDVIIGSNSFIDCGATIGSESILYFEDNGNNRSIRHAGGITIGKNVMILSNVIIAKSIHPTFYTSVGDNCLIGPRSTIGHEAQVEGNCIILGNCVIARKAFLGEKSWIGSSSVIREHVKIGKRAKVMVGSIVLDDVFDDDEVSGNFAFSHEKHLRKFLGNK